MRYALIILVMIVTMPSSLMASEDPKAALRAALDAERASRPEEAIRRVETLLASTALHGSDVVAAWNILGLSYADEERFNEARKAYERAAASFSAIPDASSRLSELGDLLSNWGDLYSQMTQFDAALRLHQKALSLYQQAGNYAGIARSFAILAGIELSRNHLRAARKYVSEGDAVLPLAKDMDSDELAMFYMIRGWALEKEKNFRGELSSYTIALRLWQGKHGDNYGMSGWCHVLVGKAYFNLGNLAEADGEMQTGLPIVKSLFGEQSIRYLSAQLAYSLVLDRTGSREVAENLRRTARARITTLLNNQCTACVVSVDALR